ncbi:MAG TPA: carbon-nitrogen family hydrolase [Bacillales bacterium]|nr:carbon-nitrogen family hydrolase [Bacillales bacterium]
MKYAVWQTDIVAGDPERNRAQAAEWAAETVKIDAPDVLVLPEMWTTAYTLDRLEEVADRDGEPTLSFLRELAKQHGVHVIGGSIANKRDGEFYNTALVVNRAGEVVHTYDKIHLVPMLDEPAYLAGGTSRAALFELDGVKMAVIICYDLRFPELARQLALAGAEVLHIVAEWPSARAAHWRALQLARAIENQMPVVSCNRIGTTGGTRFCGASMVIDAWGTVLAEGSEDREETVTAAIDLTQAATVRKQVPVFASRVPDLYL